VSDGIREAIAERLSSASVIDPHCHLRPDKPSADDLADIVLYHHVWVELISAGMGQYEVSTSGLCQELADPEIPPLERVRRALPHLENIENTTLGLFLRWLLEDLYGIAGLDEDNLEACFDLVEERGRDETWQDHVLKNRCGIEYSITVQGGGEPYAETMLSGIEWFPGKLLDGKRSPRDVLCQMEEDFGRPIESAADYVSFVEAGLEKIQPDAHKFLGMWVLPCMTDALAHEEGITRILRNVKEGIPLSGPEAGSFCAFAARTVLDGLRGGSLRTIQLLVGAECLPPHRAITQWDGAFCGALGRLAGAYEGFHFNVQTASDAYTQDLAILAKHVPNVSVAGYWWHTLYPFYIRKSLETRLDIVPINKIVGYFSDAYHAEWCYPKLKMVKHILAEILVERAERGWYTVDHSLDIVDKLLYENPKRIYGV